jgi:hypothetical protein
MLMAMEAACKLQVGRDHYDGKVRLAADHIDFTGTTKFRFRLAEIAHPSRDGEALRFSFHGNPVRITLDSVGTAEEWIEHVLHPLTLADKLGAQEGQTVRVLNLDDSELLRSLANKKTKLVSNSTAHCDIVMIGVERASELRQIEGLTQRLRPDGAIWVILPKSVRTVTKANVFAAAKEAGLKQVQVMDYSDNRAAYKIARPSAPKKKQRVPGGDDNGARGRSSPAAEPVKA